MAGRSAVLLFGLGLAAALVVPGAQAIEDPTPPVVTYNIVGTKGANGWYTSNVTVNWNFSDPETNIKSWSAGCNPTTLVSDTQGTPLTCSATNHADVSTSISLTIRIDKTAPAVTHASPERAPDSGTWYTRPVTVGFHGADPTSGVEACSVVTYSGPDASGASVSGGCRDRAGNISAQTPFGFSFDATPPSLAGVKVEVGSHMAAISWKQLPAWEPITIRRSSERGKESVVYQGTASSFTDRSVLNGVKYVYVVVAADAASHTDSKRIQALPTGPLRSPAEKASVGRAPLLRWVPVRRASFYNVQLFRNGRKILSAWPVKTRLRLRKSWKWNGRRWTLAPGTYRWFVWPAYKRQQGVRYGKPLGFSDFVVASRAT
jgi:hypothetical protein